MKLLLTVLLLVHTVQCLPEFSRDACLQTINTARAEVAEKFQIANMNSLNYNKRLEPVILQQLSFVDGCPEPSIISHKNLDIYLNVRGQEDLIAELLSGTNNTMLACVKSKCNGEPIVSIVTDKVESAPIKGAPGTKCTSSTNSNGLCVLEKVRSGYNRKGLLDDLGKIIVETFGVPTKTTTYGGTVYQSMSEKGLVRKGFLDEVIEKIRKNPALKDIMKDIPRTVYGEVVDDMPKKVVKPKNQ
ncbi:hypothetical protein CAEBREN_22803 [Caenorhabditis brenneri]|uniref:Uncharacterized protein n=1 Tax=Caenorhabditis brenneri TaxID=135651 RepID=G0MD42_CAEBE|nr:hypothetical protein CAEBREN_22803 [Caenorhabditis brenneri]